MKKETTEIVVCHVCKGSGILTKAKLTCYHKGEYDYWNVECPHCKGSGLMQQKIVTETILTPFAPYKPDDGECPEYYR